jgi:hypothetical protein
LEKRVKLGLKHHSGTSIKQYQGGGEAPCLAVDGISRVCNSCHQSAFALNQSGNKREDWIQARMTELLPVPYFHVVLPYQLVVILWLYISQKIVYDTLFGATWETLQQFNKGSTKWE